MKLIPILTLAATLTLATHACSAPRVDFELITASGFPITGAQQWVDALKGIENIGIRIRSGRPGEQVSVDNLGTEASPRYQVIGILDANSRLHLPGGSFRISDRAGIAKWVEKLRAGGEAAPTEQTSVFGLTAEELLSLNDKLSRRVDVSTAQRRAGDVARDLTRALEIEVAVDPSARAAFAGRDVVVEELQGITSGTALAVVLRPLGLVLTAERTPTRDVRLVITDARRVEEFWPIGWPAEESPSKLAPDLFKFLNVEIADTPLEEALSAVQSRLDIPFFYDHNALARQRIDPAEVQVGLPEMRTYYKRIIDRMLNQAKLTSELRVDEVGKPFLWITTQLR